MKFEKMVAEGVISVDYHNYRILPELSNPPAEIVAVAPEFWNPKPKAPAHTENKSPAPGK